MCLALLPTWVKRHKDVVILMTDLGMLTIYVCSMFLIMRSYKHVKINYSVY